MKGMVIMEKIQLKAFDRRRNQQCWFHFCYLPTDTCMPYKSKFKSTNMDALIKSWLKQDFDLDVVNMEDVYTAKELIKKLYAEVYPEVFLESEGDRQGWTRVWLTNKIKHLLEVN